MIFYVCFYIIALFWLLWAMGESPSSVTRKSSSSVTRTRFLNCDAVPRLWREVGFCVAGVALCAIDGLLVWRVLGLVTSTLRFCGFPKAGLPSCSAPFSRGSASVLLSPPGGPFCPLSCPSPSKRTFLARLLFICLAVLLALSGCPFWPLSGPNPSKRTSPALPVLVCLAVLLAVSGGPALVREPPKFLKAGLPSCSFVLCPPFSCDCASVLLSLSDTPFCPLSGPNPPKRTAQLPLLVCSPALLALSGGPLWPLGGPNP